MEALAQRSAVPSAVLQRPHLGRAVAAGAPRPQMRAVRALPRVSRPLTALTRAAYGGNGYGPVGGGR